MHKISIFLLLLILSTNLSEVKLSAKDGQAYANTVIVEENYLPSETYRIVQNKSGYEKLTAHGIEAHKQSVQSTKEILRIPIRLSSHEIKDEFLLPSEIDGITMDIPYNYYSSLPSSAEYFQMLLYSGWEIEYYNSSSLCIQIGLVKDDIACRLLIYENYLKVYCRLI